MAKIHTHYDNLKVSRHAPQEVIRASYKALSQKYHPDKNPGDEKAARIMAIVNTAYNILSDPVRRKEHDEWIAAEEWEVEWLESSNTKDGQGRKPGEAGDGHAGAASRRPRLRRDPRWWLGLALCFVAGAGSTAAVLLLEPTIVPGALAYGGVAPAAASTPVDLPTGLEEPISAALATPATLRAAVVTQHVMAAASAGCDPVAPVTPPGGAWPEESGYLPGTPRANTGNDMQVLVDNSSNPSPVLVKLVDRERRAEVRQAYVLPHASFMIDKLAAGSYEVRYQNTVVDSLPGCVAEPARTPVAPVAEATLPELPPAVHSVH